MSYLLDTNVLSEIMRPKPADVVVSWLTSKTVGDLFVAATTMQEIVYGICRLPIGRRRSVLQTAFDDLFASRFDGRVEPFDRLAALRCGEIRAAAAAAGRPAGIADAEIAAIALTRSMTVATRDIGDFSAFGVAVVNPFEARAQP